MFLDYLINKNEELEKKIAEKEKDLDKVLFLLKENKRFTELLEREKTTPFTEFTPQVVSASDRKIQDDLLEKEEQIQREKKLLEDELEKLGVEHNELLSAIKDAKNILHIERAPQHKEDNKMIKEKLARIVKEGEYNPAKAISSLRKLLHEL